LEGIKGKFNEDKINPEKNQLESGNEKFYKSNKISIQHDESC
jgi:hypothetical protein